MGKNLVLFFFPSLVGVGVFRDGGKGGAASTGPIPIALNLMDASVNAKKVSFCGNTGHSRCGEVHRPAWPCRMRDHSLNRSNPFLLQVWFAFPFKYKRACIWHGL